MNEDKAIVLNRFNEIVSDKKHLISREQIEVVIKDTQIGDIVCFKRDEEEIYGEIKEKYPHIFVLTDGRSFKWVDYIIGSPAILQYLKAKYPVDRFIYDFVCVPAKPNYSHNKKEVS